MLCITWAAIPPYEPRLKVLGPFITIFALYLWYRVFTSPYRIVVRDDSVFVFHAILKKTEVAPKDITSMTDYMSSIKIKHSMGRIVVSSLMDNISGFKAALLSVRPDLKIEDSANRRFFGK